MREYECGEREREREREREKEREKEREREREREREERETPALCGTNLDLHRRDIILRNGRHEQREVGVRCVDGAET